jgi:membrane-associated phospholipid phosphatase
VSSAARRAACASALLSACFTLTSPVRAEALQYQRPFGWEPNWRRVSAPEFVLTGAAGIAALTIYLEVPDAREPHWTGGIFLDEILRDDFRATTPEGRHIARSASDITALSAMGWAVGIDSIIVPMVRHSPDMAGQLTAMDAEGFAFSLLISTVIFKLVGRARPSYSDCHHNPLFEPLCNSSVTASFPSGHTTASFTAAGLSCAHHLHTGLYGSQLADSLACAGAITLAAATGTLRVVGDRHYATDVWAGAAIGFAVGYGLPTLLHYGKVHDETQTAQTAQPLTASMPFGPTFGGTF